MDIRYKPLDFYDDSNLTMLQKFASEDIKWMGNCQVQFPDDIEKLADSDFALVDLADNGEKIRKFPVNNRDAVKLSSSYFVNTYGNLDADCIKKTAESIRRASIKHCLAVHPKVEELRHGAIVKKASGKPKKIEAEYAFVKTANRREIKIFPIHTPNALTRSMEEFSKVASGVKGRVKFDIAKRLSEKCAEHKIARHPALREYISPLYASDDEIKIACAARRDLIHDVSTRKQVDAIEKFAMEAAGAPDKLAEAMETFDKEAGIDRYYGKSIASPWDSIIKLSDCPGPSSEIGYAPENGNIYNDVTGEYVAKKKVTDAIKSDKFKQYFGEKAVNIAGKDAGDFDKLPEEVRRVVLTYMV